MRILRTIKQMSNFSKKAKCKGESIGFVPTMGALHEGHLSLIRCARKENDIVVVSIFVNPIQFGPKEDFKKYPRNLKEDARLCAGAGVDAIFYPYTKELYPINYKTYVSVSGLSDCLCGTFRPGHFQGVATVVTKLFNLVKPDTAYFGQKDAQQAIIIKKMVKDLNMPVKIKIMPTIRGRDGLALSSRNTYLNEKEREKAVVLHQALVLAKDLIKRGNKDTVTIIRKMRQLIKRKKAAKIDYISVVDLSSLKPLKRVSGKCLIALAVWIGKTRLIDNIIISHS